MTVIGSGIVTGSAGAGVRVGFGIAVDVGLGGSVAVGLDGSVVGVSPAGACAITATGAITAAVRTRPRIKNATILLSPNFLMLRVLLV